MALAFSSTWATVLKPGIGTASGFVVEGLETYYPQSPRYYMADPKDVFCEWTHQRDWMYINLWGRLGYDPATPDETFEADPPRPYCCSSAEGVFALRSIFISSICCVRTSIS